MNDNVRYCPKCGDIKTINFGFDVNCDYCKTPYCDTEYDNHESCERGNLKPEIRKAIFEKYIKDNPEYSEEAVKNREEQERYDRLHMPSSSGYSSQNQPKCPTCQSTNVTKISTAKKAFGFAAVGVFSSNFGKTMECKNCGYKW